MELHILLDSGSSLNLLAEKSVHKLHSVMSPPFQGRLQGVNGASAGSTQQCLVDLNLMCGNKVMTYKLTCRTHPLGVVQDSIYPIIPRFVNNQVQVDEYLKLNGVFPRQGKQLDILLSDCESNMFMKSINGRIGYSPWIELNLPNTNPKGIVFQSVPKLPNDPKFRPGVIVYETIFGNVYSGYCEWEFDDWDDETTIKMRKDGLKAAISHPKYRKAKFTFTADVDQPHYKAGQAVDQTPVMHCYMDTSTDIACPDGYSTTKDGKTTITFASSVDKTLYTTLYTTEDLVVLFKRFVELDRLPLDLSHKTMTEEEVSSTHLINKYMVLDTKRRRMSSRLLLKPNICLANNYFSTKKRLDQMHARFLRAPEKTKKQREMYYKKFQEFVDLGVLHEVQDDEPHINTNGRLKYYLPMSVVEKLTSLTTPYRLVVEGNAKTATGLSLNDNIYDMPSLHLKIADIELRSRLKKVLVIADIKKLFLNLKNDSDSDQDLMRVLYRPPGGKPDDPVQIRKFSCHIWGLKDAPGQLNTALHKCVIYWRTCKERTPFELSICDQFVRSLYVDDLTLSFDNAQIAIKAIDVCNQIVAVGGFEFRKWLSNSPEVLEAIPEDRRAPFTTVVELDKGQELEKVISHPALQLGYSYNPKEDCYVMDRFDKIQESRDCFTKRGLASALASVYDVLKLTGPFLLTAKRLLKETFRYGLHWNDPLEKMFESEKMDDKGRQRVKHLLDLYKQWLADLPRLSTLKFPRYLSSNEGSTFIIASDASDIGLAAVCHCVTRQTDGTVVSHLVNSVVNITPLNKDMDKELSIPLLELKAMFYATEIGVWLQKEGDVLPSQILYVGDSRVSIAWSLKKPETLLHHIAKPVRFMQENNVKFHYVSTTENAAADLASRGCLLDGIKSDIWLYGPKWYTLPFSQMPIHDHVATEEKYRINLGLLKKYSVLEGTDSSDMQIQHAITTEKTSFIASHHLYPRAVLTTQSHISKEYLEKVLQPECFNRIYNTELVEEADSSKQDVLKLEKSGSRPGLLHRSIKKSVQRLQEKQSNLKDKESLSVLLPKLSYYGITDWAYSKLIKSTALIFFAVERFKLKGQKISRTLWHKKLYVESTLQARTQQIVDYFPLLTTAHKAESRFFYIIQSQLQHYEAEFHALNKLQTPDGQMPSVKLRSSIASYSPFLADTETRQGFIMVASGRHNTDNAEGGASEDGHLPFSLKHPPILPPYAKFTLLLIKHTHCNAFPRHAGSLQVYNHLSREVCIPQGRRMCKRICHTCVRCKKNYARRFKQLMGSLPKAMTPIEGIRPFQHCSLDYTGYIDCKPHGMGNKHKYKVYLCVFYCLWSKGFHIEIATSTDTKSFLNAFERLSAQRGRPEVLYSDDQPGFVKTDKMIKERLSAINSKIKDDQEHGRFEWNFSLPYKPNSLWEKPIHLVKMCLSRSIRNEIFTYEDLLTAVQGITFTLNERPLMADRQTSNGKFGFISPNRLICGYDLSHMPLQFHKTTVPFKQDRIVELRKIDKVRQNFANAYTKEYLVEAKQRQNFFRPNVNIHVDDLVLLQSVGSRQFEKRQEWSLGRITEIHRSPRDNLVRRVGVIEAPLGKFRIRSIHDVCPLIDEPLREDIQAFNNCSYTQLEDYGTPYQPSFDCSLLRYPYTPWEDEKECYCSYMLLLADEG